MISQTWIGLLFFVAFVAVAVFYLITLQRLLEAVSIENRKMPPGQVWLLLIPVFNIVWHFIVVWNISDSIKNECIKLNIPQSEQRPTFLLGILSMSLYVIALILNTAVGVPLIGGLFSLVSFGFFIGYWIQLNQHKKLLLANQDNFLFDAERESDETQ